MTPKCLGPTGARFAPATRMVPSRFPIHDIWRKAQDASAPQPRADAQHTLITRPAFDSVITSLSTAEGGAVLGAAVADVDAALVLGLLVLVLTGPGPLSVDRLIGQRTAART